MKTYKTTDKRTGKQVELIRIETKFMCLGCFFFDEEIGDCMAPMPIELGDDCMEADLVKETTKQFQFIEK